MINHKIYKITCTDIDARDGEPTYKKYRAKLLAIFRRNKSSILKELDIKSYTKLQYDYDAEKHKEMTFYIYYNE